MICASACRLALWIGATFPDGRHAQMRGFVLHYNHQNHHVSLSNLTPADAGFGRGQVGFPAKEKIDPEPSKNSDWNAK